MGTRGAYGFRIDSLDKVTYNHFDSYPDQLGKNIMEYIVATPSEIMKEVAHAIILVDPKSKPGPELISRYARYADLGVSDQRYDDWYCLLRKTQGDLFAYNNDLRHMIDSHNFLYDSLFCEWAYIINLDQELFEVYRGFNKDSLANGRYAAHEVTNNNGYKGVALICETPLIDIKPESIEDIVRRLGELGGITLAA